MWLNSSNRRKKKARKSLIKSYVKMDHSNTQNNYVCSKIIFMQIQLISIHQEKLLWSFQSSDMYFMFQNNVFIYLFFLLLVFPLCCSSLFSVCFWTYLWQKEWKHSHGNKIITIIRGSTHVEIGTWYWLMNLLKYLWHSQKMRIVVSWKLFQLLKVRKILYWKFSSFSLCHA